MATGFRSSQIQDKCGLCDEVAVGRCPRCGRWTCAKHGTERPDRRCRQCEAEWEARGTAEDVGWGCFTPIGVGLLSMILALPIKHFWGETAALWFVIGCVALMVIGPILAATVLSGWIYDVTRRRRRAQFLGQRFEQGPPPRMHNLKALLDQHAAEDDADPPDAA